MSTIAATGSSSGYSAVAQLLADSLSNSAATSGLPQIGQAGSSNAAGTSSSGPTDSVDLSDHAKAVLAQAQKDQVLANQLQAFVQSKRSSAGAGSNSIVSQPGPNQPASAQTSGSVTQAFAQLTGQAQRPSQQLLSNWTIEQAAADPGGFVQAEQAAHTQADGTVTSWSVSFQDVTPVGAPSTPQAIDQWYATQGQEYLQFAQVNPAGSPPGLVDAIRNHTLTFTNVSDIPGIDFHSSYVFEGGEDGAGGGGNCTFNGQALQTALGSNYLVSGDGYVVTWSSSPAQQTTAQNSQPANPAA